MREKGKRDEGIFIEEEKETWKPAGHVFESYWTRNNRLGLSCLSLRFCQLRFSRKREAGELRMTTKAESQL